jgi:hypothetical protein
MKQFTVLSILVLLLLVGFRSYQTHLLARADTPSRRAQGEDERYPYAETAFTGFVGESFREARRGAAEDYYGWFEDAYSRSTLRYPEQESRPLPDLLEWKRQELARVTDPAARGRQERELAGWVHAMVKKVIPKFSLDRGFEFVNVVRHGERQCFLQSVLIAGLLQKAGVPAGVAMVYKNVQGRPTNNGHAVTVVRLASGRDIVVDASDPEPFVRQAGLFLRTAGYAYVDPVYDTSTSEITAYRTAGSAKRLQPSEVRTLDIPFLHSQFYYYRGERAPGGVLFVRKSRAGLAASIAHLRKSVELCPANPLSVYTLGRAYLAQGKTRQATPLLTRAFRLYDRYGWVPSGPRDAYSRLTAAARPNG